MEALREDLREYWGKINEIKAGLKVKDLEKPEPLIRFEQAKELGISYRAGGLIDQPHIWLMEHAVISHEMMLWQASNSSAQGS